MPNASDIITFIGVPLAVLGVLPILYTAINSLITLRRIQNTLKRNGLSEATTRGSLMSGIIEVSLPRFSITPLDRDEEGYWGLNLKPSVLKGGTWTLLNWNSLVTGSKLYRLQYSNDLEVPQAEIDFEELLDFLLDRGAVPDVKGLHMLRVSGLWTPTGTSLLLSPDTLHNVLRVCIPDDSDGILSLAMSWNAGWDIRDPGLLPPSWMRLQVPQSKSSAIHEDAAENPAINKLTDEETSNGAILEKPAPGPTSIRFRLGHTGSSVAIDNASWEFENLPCDGDVSLDHLHSQPASNWIPSIALALGLSKSLPLYNHSLDPALSALAARESVPCGVLVVLGLLDESQAPPWETKYDQNEFHRQFVADAMAEQREIAAERMMSPDQRAIAKTKREATKSQRFFDRSIQNSQRQKQRMNQRQREAVGSSRLDAATVMNAATRYLRSEKSSNANGDVQTAVETLLVGMIKMEEEALCVCTVLEKWRQWSDRGGMTIEDLEFLEKKKRAFCYATCVVGLFGEVGAREESGVAVDIKQCVQHWKKVRIG